MADLIQYLVPPSSQESYHSTHETFHDAEDDRATQYNTPAPDNRSLAATTTSKQENTTIAALQAAGLSVQDVNSYLADPENERLLAETSSKKRKGGNSKENNNNAAAGTSTGGSVLLPEPVQLGNPKSAHHIVQLLHLCQERGLRPIYDIDEPTPQRFIVVLRFGEFVVSMGEDVTFESKREAKEAAAAKGVELLKDVPIPGSGGAKGSGTEENWVGKLVEFHSTETPTAGPIYTEYALGLNFACECTIPKAPDTTFGNRTVPFPNKKAAKANAAREAVLWLKENGYMSTGVDGTVVNNSSINGGKKKGKSGATAIVAEVDDKRKEVSFAARVNELCPRLSLCPPEYHLTASPLSQAMYSGAAHFVQNRLQIPGPVGEVRLVFGRKNAREACAEMVLAFLREMERERRAVEV